jgi:hypothetical protein
MVRDILKAKALAARLNEGSRPNYDLDKIIDALDEMVDAAIEYKAAQGKQELIKRLKAEASQPEVLVVMEAEERAINAKRKPLEAKLGDLPRVKKTLAQKATAEKICEAAKAQGAINPDIVALAVQDQIEAHIKDNGNVSINVTTGGTLGDLIKRTKENPEYSIMFGAIPEADKDRVGAPRVNPWKKETFNLTAQGQIFRRDPALAERLKAEAQPPRWNQFT